jgi:hypothetical protein
MPLFCHSERPSLSFRGEAEESVFLCFVRKRKDQLTQMLRRRSHDNGECHSEATSPSLSFVNEAEESVFPLYFSFLQRHRAEILRLRSLMTKVNIISNNNKG